MPRQILITGGSGMIGANLTHALVRRNDAVTILSRPSSDRWRMAALKEKVRIVEFDYEQGDDVNSVIEDLRPDVLFHLASTPFNPPSIAPESHFAVNVGMTMKLLDGIRAKSPHTKFIFAGSCAAYGQGDRITEDMSAAPETMLGVAKQSARMLIEVYAKLYGLMTLNLCLFTPFGPWEGRERLIPHIILSALNGRDIEMTEGTQQRDYLFVDDVVDAFICAMDEVGHSGETLNICSGTSMPVRDVARKLLDIMGKDVELKLGALATRPDEIRIVSGDNEKALNVLNWSPSHSLDEALMKTVSWYQENKNLYV